MLNLKFKETKLKVTTLLLTLGIECSEIVKKKLEGKFHFNFQMIKETNLF